MESAVAGPDVNAYMHVHVWNCQAQPLSMRHVNRPEGCKKCLCDRHRVIPYVVSEVECRKYMIIHVD